MTAQISSPCAANSALERGDIVVRQMRDPRRIGTEAGRVFRLPAGGDGEERAAVETQFIVETMRVLCRP